MEPNYKKDSCAIYQNQETMLRKNLMKKIRNRIEHNNDKVLLEMLNDYCDLKPMRQDEKILYDFIKTTYYTILKKPDYVNKNLNQMTKMIDELTLNIKSFDGKPDGNDIDIICLNMGSWPDIFKFEFSVLKSGSCNSNDITIKHPLYEDMDIELWPTIDPPYNYVRPSSNHKYEIFQERIYEHLNYQIPNVMIDDKKIVFKILDDIFHNIFVEILFGDAYDPISTE